MPEAKWFVYLLECRDARIYTGVTPDLEKRLIAHRVGKGAKFTKANPPVAVLAFKSCADRREAMRLEIEIKRLRREQKIALAKAWAAEQPIATLAAKVFPRD